MQTLGNLDLNVLLRLYINKLPQEMVLLKLHIVGSGKRTCMKVFILTILLNQIWPMTS